MADSQGLTAQLRKMATGRIEWRVQDPVERCYCMTFSRDDSHNPERDAREWLADFQRKFPNHPHAKYEVARVHVFSEFEEAALKAADELDAKAELAAVVRELVLCKRQGMCASTEAAQAWDDREDAAWARAEAIVDGVAASYGDHFTNGTCTVRVALGADGCPYLDNVPFTGVVYLGWAADLNALATWLRDNGFKRVRADTPSSEAAHA